MKSYERYKNDICDDIETCIDSMGCQPILFIGSGFSRRYFGAPNWYDLLKIIANRCPLIDREFAYYRQSYDDAITIGTVFSNLCKEWAWSNGRDNFPEYLFQEDYPSSIYIKYMVSEHFKEILPQNWYDELSTELKVEIDILKKISPHSIITTNYDNLIEEIFPNFEPVIGQKILKTNTFCVGELFKIHGSASDPESLVLTEDDYSGFEKNKKYLSAKLLTLFAEHPMVLIGYSASDPNIQAILSDIDEILAPDNSLVPNIYILEYSSTIKPGDFSQKEKNVIIGENRNIRIKNIIASDFSWVFKAFSSSNVIEPINPKLLRALLSRTYQLIRHDIPRNTVEVDFEMLERAADTENELAKLYGITTLDNPAQLNAKYPYTLSQVGKKLGFNSWHYANKIIDTIKNDKGINLKASDNKYHMTVRLGEKSSTHKYSQDAVDLLDKVNNEESYKIDLE